MSYPRLEASDNVDMHSQFLYRYIHGVNDIYYPHTHDYFEIFLTLRGTVTHQVNGVTQLLPEGTLVFIRPDDLHGYIYDDPKSSESAYINVTFTRQTAAELFTYLSDAFPSKPLQHCDMPPTVQLSPTEKERLFLQLQQLNTARWRDKTALKLRMRVILADIFVRYFSSVPSQQAQRLPEWLAQLMTDMEAPESFIAGLEYMIAKSGKSREHLSHCMKKYCNMTLTEYINSLRVNYACNLLINTNIPVIDICYQCGFLSMSYFYKVFKSNSQLSPNALRSKYQR